MMGFAAPLGLLALLSIAIPILVHLRRKPARPIRVGTIRYLDGSAPRPRAGPRVSELVLLLVRAALLGLVAAALAEPFAAAGSPSRPRNIVVTADSVTDLWAILRDLDDTLPAGSSVVLGIPGRVTVSGGRPSIATAVTIEAAPTSAAAEPLRPTLRRLVIVAPPARIEAVHHLRAAFGAVAASRGDSLVIFHLAMAVPDSLRGEWVIWLADSVPAESVASHGASVLAEAPGGAPSGLRIGRADPGVFARRAGRGVLYELAGRFEPGSAALAAGTLPEIVAAIWPGDDAAVRPAPVTASQLQPARRAERRDDRRAPLATPLLGVAALIFLVERVLAHRALDRSRVAP